MSKKLFVSQPMNGRSNRIIGAERKAIVEKYELEGWEVIDSIMNLGPADAIVYLAESIKLLNDADCVLFMKGWERARGCKIEHEVAVAYGKEIVYE